MSMFGNLITFGQSNKSQQGAVTQGVPATQGYQTGASQIATPANNNAQPNPPGNTGTPNTDPVVNADPNKGQAGSQLDGFKDIFTIKTDDKGNPVTPADPLSQPLLTMDPTKLQEAARKMNLAGTIDPQLMTKALAGDAGALAALLNQGAQNAFLAATNATSAIVEEAVRKNNQRYDAALPDRIRDHQLQNSASSNPILNHPAAKPLVDGMKAQIAAANPHLSAEAVQQKAEAYVVALNSDMNAATATAAKAAEKPSGSDFTSFLN